MQFNKNYLDELFLELSKKYKKMCGTQKIPFEIIVVGGASILLNYSFRDCTSDIDALYSSSEIFKEAIDEVAKEKKLDIGWLNNDVMRTASYSDKLREYSKPYNTFYNVIDVRTIKAEYLVAMKLMSGRMYKNDLSDIIGIIIECKKSNTEINIELIHKAVIELYGSTELISEDNKQLLIKIFNHPNLDEMYKSVVMEEKENKSKLIDFNHKYKNVLNEDNIHSILKKINTNKSFNKNNETIS